MEKDEKEIKELEDDYSKLKSKYDLPEFEKLCEDFDVEKLVEKDTMFLLRNIRRTINEKLAAYINLFESLINPSSPPIFVFSILRGLSTEDKERMREIYKKLSRTQLQVMKLDVQYAETLEAKFISSSFKLWQSIKPEILEIVKSFERNFEKDNEAKKSTYFD